MIGSFKNSFKNKKIFVGWDCFAPLALAMTILLLRCGGSEGAGRGSGGGGGNGGGNGNNWQDVYSNPDRGQERRVTLAPLRIETWTLSPEKIPYDLPGAEVRIDNDTQSRCLTPCDLEVETGTHLLYLTLSGWVQGPHPLEINVTTDGVIVNTIPSSIVITSGSVVRHRLERDLTGRWRRQSDGHEDDVTIQNTPPWPCPSLASPDSCVSAGPFQPLGGLFIEGETLTLCKTHAPECGNNFAEGRILDDGRRVEFTAYFTGIPNTSVYIKLD